MMAAGIVRGLWAFLKIFLFFCVLAYVGLELHRRLEAIPAAGLRVDYIWLGFALLLTAGSSALTTLIYREMQQALESPVDPLPPALAALISPIGKYLPGKVGSLVGAIWIYRAFGIGATTATAVTLLAAAATFAAVSLIIAPFLVSGELERLDSTTLRWLFVGVCLGGVLLAFPRIFVAATKYLSKRFWRQPLLLSLTYSHYLRGVAVTAIQLALMGTAFWFVARALGPLALSDWYLLTASLAVSGIVGFVAFFAPAGIGVREALLLTLLGGKIGDPYLALAVLLLRVNQILAEIFLALVGAILWRNFRRLLPRDACGAAASSRTPWS